MSNHDLIVEKSPYANDLFQVILFSTDDEGHRHVEEVHEVFEIQDALDDIIMNNTNLPHHSTWTVNGKEVDCLSLAEALEASISEFV